MKKMSRLLALVMALVLALGSFTTAMAEDSTGYALGDLTAGLLQGWSDAIWGHYANEFYNELKATTTEEEYNTVMASHSTAVAEKLISSMTEEQRADLFAHNVDLSAVNGEALTATAVDGGVVVDAPAGAFPTGTAANVAAVTDEAVLAALTEAIAAVDETAQIVSAYDINFNYSALGQTNEVQPKTAVPLTFEVASADLSEDCTGLAVYHMAEDGNGGYVAELVGESEITAEETQSIATYGDKFSIYVVSSRGGTWNLYNYAIYMSVGDTIELTATSARDDERWSLTAGDTSSFSFGNDRTGRTVELTATSTGTATVSYYNQTIEVTAVEAVGDIDNDIIFKRITVPYSGSNEYQIDEYNNTYGQYVMKIRFEDSAGNLLPMGKDYYVFDSAVPININTFAASAPAGYTYDGAYFFWNGHTGDNADRIYVTEVTRLPTLGNAGSYLYFDHGTVQDDYYQPSGVLHIVYRDSDEAYNIVFKDHEGTVLHSFAPKKADKGYVTIDSSYVATLDTTLLTNLEANHNTLTNDYEFTGNWVVTGGTRNGINGTYKTSDLKSSIPGWEVSSDITITAECVLKSGNLRIQKQVIDDLFTTGTKAFTFTVKPDSASTTRFAAWASTNNYTLDSNGAITVTVDVPATATNKTATSDTLAGLPIGTYTVTEIDDETAQPYVVDAASKTITVANGATATASFTNTREYVDVKVTKIWEDNSDAADQRPESIVITLNGETTQTVTLNETNAVSGNENQWTYTWSNLPKLTNDGTAITYTVTETQVANYKAPVVSADLDSDDDFEYTITNEIDVTDLSFTKKVVTADGSATAPADSEFTFKVTLTDGNGTALASKTFGYIKNDAETAVEFTTDANGAYTFTGIKANDEIVIKNLPIGTKYAVEETVLPTGYSIPDASKSQSGTLTAKADLTFTNTYTTKSIIVNKTVVGTDAPKETESFAFTLTLTNSNLTKVSSKMSTETAAVEKDLTNGVLNFSLKHGENITFSGIPAGAGYTVAEVLTTEQADKYTTMVNNAEGLTASAEKLTDNVTVAYVNTYKTGSLTINKTASPDTNEYFVFEVAGNGVTMEVAIQGSGSVTISNLPFGIYTVTETKWAWRYEPENKVYSKSATITEIANGTVSFTNNKTENKWLDFEAYADNDFNGENPNAGTDTNN